MISYFLAIFNFSTEKMRKKNCAQKLNFRGARIPSTKTTHFARPKLDWQFSNGQCVLKLHAQLGLVKCLRFYA